MVEPGIVESAAPVEMGRGARAEARTGRFSSILLHMLVFVGGFASIGVELTASRLMAPYFGSSTFIWASLIGLTLLFLSLGYLLGGRIADRRPDPQVLYAACALAAVTIGLLPLVARPLLLGSLTAFQQLDAGAFYGSLFGTLVLLAPPIILLGFISPFAIRLQLTDVDSAGQTAGGLYALSTVGSIAGSFLPVLVFIPLLGTNATFLTLALVLLIPSLTGLALARAGRLVMVVALFALTVPALALASPAAIRPPDRGTLLAERESAYNYIQVVADDAGARYLILNEGHAVHSVYDPRALLTGGPWDYVMIAPLLAEGAAAVGPRDALVIGLAGGTMARQLTAAYGPIPIDGVEIDPEIAAIGREYFGLDDLANVSVHIADGRYALRTADHAYDLIVIDAYRQPYIPFQLTSREFFQEVAAKLRPGGVVLVNAGRTATDFRLVDALGATMRDVFPSVTAIDVNRYTNTMLVGSEAALSSATLVANVAQQPEDSPVRDVANWALATGNVRAIEPGGTVYTDDRAPVEMLIDTMILDAARSLTGS
ncbi:MAG: fused MFS/spermidine synthase [Thermomicrobiales bacterium]